MWGNEKDRYIRLIIDSRECPLTNKAEIAEAIEFWGEDSDYIRVRVRGLPPSAADTQFIPLDMVNEAQSLNRVASYTDTDSLVAGVDLSWGGEDKTCIRFRRGMDARTIPPVYVPGDLSRDPNHLVRVLVEILNKSYGGRQVDMMFVDSAGICGPVVRTLREMNYNNVLEVNFGAFSSSPKYKLMRSYMWGMLKEALPQMTLDKSAKLADDLCAPEYSLTRKSEILLEPKDRIRKPDRLGRSTDDADALALTFAMPVISKAAALQKKRGRGFRRRSAATGAWS
jgi:hypothetical protein